MTPSNHNASGIRSFTSNNKLALLTFGVAVLAWVLDSMLDSYVFKNGTFTSQLFSPDWHELSLRTFFISIIILIAIYSEKNITRYNRAKNEMEAVVLKLADEKNRSEAIISAIGDGIVIQDTDYTILYQNQVNKGLIGDHIGELCYKAFEHRDRICENCPVELAFKDGKIHKDERIVKKSGGLLHVEITGSPLIDSAGKIIAGIKVVRDITDRKMAEVTLQQSEEKYRTLFNTMAQGVVYQDAEGKITYANPAAEKILGISVDQMTGRTSADPRWRAIHENGEDFPGETHPAMVALTIGKEISNVVMGVYNPENDEYRWININAVPQFRPGEDKPYQVYTTFEDITQRRRAEDELRKGERLLVSVFASIQDGICVLDSDFNIIHVNQTATSWYPHSVPFKGKKCYKAFHGRDEPCEVCPVQQTIITGKSAHETVHKSGPKGENIGWVEIYSFPLIDTDTGKMGGVIEYVRDITERKKMLEVLQRRVETEKLIASISAGFINVSNENMDDNINQVLKSIGEFIGVDRAFIYQLRNNSVLDNTNEWCAEGVQSHFQALKDPHLKNYPWSAEVLHNLEMIKISNVDDMPQEAQAEKKLMESYGIKSMILVPLIHANSLFGLMGFDSERTVKTWNEEEIRLIKIIREIISIAMERRKAEEDLRQSNNLLDAISGAQSRFISDHDPNVLFGELLENLLSLTKSEYGFIGEVLQNEAGKKFLKTRAITNIAWNKATLEFYEKNAPDKMEFYNLNTLFGRVITTGQPLIVNEPVSSPWRGGLPSGHPEINSFMGLPFYQAEKLMGMVGIANRPTGYNEKLIEYLQPFLNTCASMMEAARNEQKRRHAEDELTQRAHQAELGSNVGMALTRGDTLQPTLQQCAESIVECLDAAFARIWVFDQAENVLKLQASAGIYTDINGSHSRVPVGRYMIGKIAQEHKPFWTNNVIGDSNIHDQEWARREKLVSFAGYPLIVEDRLEGVMAMFARHELTDSAIEALASVADSIALGIKQKRSEDAIKKYAEKLEESNRMKILFSDIMHHDLSNPLNIANNYSELLRESEADPQKIIYLENIEKNLMRMRELTENATLLSKLDSMEKIEFEHIDLKTIIETSVESIKPLADSFGMKVEDRIIDIMPTKANKIIETVFANLLSNAIKYASRGKRIILEGHESDGFWRIKVIDFGEGIPNDDKSGLFERFHRMEKKGVKGSGLGLAISRKIIELHEGRIWVEDNPEGGAVFVVEIPKLI